MSARRLAPVLGVLVGLASLLVAALVSLALTDLARVHLAEGASLMGLALLLRVGLGAVSSLLRERRQREVVSEWTPRLSRHFPRSMTLTSALDALGLLPDDVEIDLARASLGASMAGLALLYLASGWLPLVIVLALMSLSAPLYVRAGRAAEVMDVEYRQKHSRLLERELELLNAGVELRGLGVGRFAVEDITALSRGEHRVAEEALRVALRSSLVTEFLSGVSVGLVAMVVGFALMGGRTGLERALLSVLVSAEVFSHVRRYGLLFHRKEQLARARSTLELWRDEPEVTRSSHLVALGVRTRATTDPVTFELRAGERLALLGASGAGKTTLCRTLFGWEPLLEGSLQVPSGPLAYVSIETRLPDGTLNDLVGGPLTSDERRNLLARLGLGNELTENLDAVRVSDGEGLSTGERVRVLIARALARGSALIVLDDVAGALDDDSRGRVRDVLEEFPGAVLEAGVDGARLIRARKVLRL